VDVRQATVAVNMVIAVQLPRSVELDVKVVLVLEVTLHLLHTLPHLLLVADRSLPRGIVRLMVRKDHAFRDLVVLIPQRLVAME